MLNKKIIYSVIAEDIKKRIKGGRGARILSWFDHDLAFIVVATATRCISIGT